MKPDTDFEIIASTTAAILHNIARPGDRDYLTSEEVQVFVGVQIKRAIERARAISEPEGERASEEQCCAAYPDCLHPASAQPTEPRRDCPCQCHDAPLIYSDTAHALHCCSFLPPVPAADHPTEPTCECGCAPWCDDHDKPASDLPGEEKGEECLGPDGEAYWSPIDRALSLRVREGDGPVYITDHYFLGDTEDGDIGLFAHETSTSLGCGDTAFGALSSALDHPSKRHSAPPLDQIAEEVARAVFVECFDALHASGIGITVEGAEQRQSAATATAARILARHFSSACPYRRMPCVFCPTKEK